ncbi:hypothetical protein V6N13_088777 [Hibiscus sabdariffa]
MIDDEVRRMHHGLEHEYEVMDNDDPDEANGEVDVTVHHMSSGNHLAGTGMNIVPSQHWNVEIFHVLREGNKLADCMAECASHTDLICHRFLTPPDAVRPQLEEDFHSIPGDGG